MSAYRLHHQQLRLETLTSHLKVSGQSTPSPLQSSGESWCLCGVHSSYQCWFMNMELPGPLKWKIFTLRALNQRRTVQVKEETAESGTAVHSLHHPSRVSFRSSNRKLLAPRQRLIYIRGLLILFIILHYS